VTDFWRGKSVFVTGHTGFKGAWLCEILNLLGAKVTGYALPPSPGSTYDELNIDAKIASDTGDIRDFERLRAAFASARPQVVLHLAAQPLVLDAYERPAHTFDTNVMGTVNLLECVRQGDRVRSVVVITTDKVYRNNEWVYGYRENDALGGADPYSASKACAELVAESYAASFLRDFEIALSTARAGNVIGGGDVSAGRIVPDCVRAAKSGEAIIVRNPNSVRPYQHVLEALFAYLLIARKQYEDIAFASNYNIGPAETDCITTAELTGVFLREWGSDRTWRDASNSGAPHENGLLKLDCSKMRSAFRWKPVWDVAYAVRKTVEWEKSANKQSITISQINEYMETCKDR
jgi:CDP-glucose 4,6-dehydratase